MKEQGKKMIEFFKEHWQKILILLIFINSSWLPLKDTLYIKENKKIIKVVGQIIKEATKEEREKQEKQRLDDKCEAEKERMKLRKEIEIAKIYESIYLMRHHLDGIRTTKGIDKEMNFWFRNNWGIQITAFKHILRSEYAQKVLKDSMHSRETYKAFINHKK